MEIPDVGAVGSFVQWTKQDKTVKKKKPKQNETTGMFWGKPIDIAHGTGLHCISAKNTTNWIPAILHLVDFSQRTQFPFEAFPCPGRLIF